MRAFTCPACARLVFFANSVCLACGTEISYSRSARTMVRADSGRHCANLTAAACNWLIDEQTPDGGLCFSCALTRTRPADGDPAAMAAFALTEQAKRRLVYQLDDLGLPIVGRVEDPVGGLAFDLLSSAVEPVVTGHASGVITFDLAEGDAGHRERMRVGLDEPYRTLLGHLRHETGHWYWEVMVDRPGLTGGFRVLFGDERADYAKAIAAHYDSSAAEPAEWAHGYVSAYANAHPWEDWAETFAHYLHIRDTLQTAAAYGITVNGPQNPQLSADLDLSAEPVEDPNGFAEIIDNWLPLTYALNAVNRSMGARDLYPFVLAPLVLEKLRYVHNLVTAGVTYLPARG